LATTRETGCSIGPFASFNLADHVGDDPRQVAANRRHLRELVPGMPVEPSWLNQVHGRVCVSLDTVAAESPIEADASLATDSRHVCAILTADCLPVLLCDEAGTAVAAAHAGWRGLAGGILEVTVAAFAQPPQRLMAWLGPAIGPAAFEVGNEVREAFTCHDGAAAAAFVPGRNGKWLCDLYALARRKLAIAGVIRVYGGGYCTFNDAQRFFSYRRDGRTGRMATLIWIDAPA
jgi:hypothetical protein